jgi:hypothetical protein
MRNVGSKLVFFGCLAPAVARCARWRHHHGQSAANGSRRQEGFRNAQLNWFQKNIFGDVWTPKGPQVKPEKWMLDGSIKRNRWQNPRGRCV